MTETAHRKAVHWYMPICCRKFCYEVHQHPKQTDFSAKRWKWLAKRFPNAPEKWHTEQKEQHGPGNQW